jgi:hypothetical protein
MGRNAHATSFLSHNSAEYHSGFSPGPVIWTTMRGSLGQLPSSTPFAPVRVFRTYTWWEGALTSGESGTNRRQLANGSGLYSSAVWEFLSRCRTYLALMKPVISTRRSYTVQFSPGAAELWACFPWIMDRSWKLKYIHLEAKMRACALCLLQQSHAPRSNAATVTGR